MSDRQIKRCLVFGGVCVGASVIINALRGEFKDAMYCIGMLLCYWFAYKELGK